MKIYSGGPLDVPNETLAQMFWRVSRANPSKNGFRARPAKGQPFKTWSFKQVGDIITEIGNGLLSAGVKPGDRVAILSDTRMEWSLADFAIFSVNGVTVTVYPTLTNEQTAYLFNDSETSLVFVEDQKQLDKVATIVTSASTVRRYVTLTPCKVPDNLAKMTSSLDSLRDEGRAYASANPGKLQARIDAGKPEDLATLVYTSGTTGTPKGAILTHRNFVSALKAAQKLLDLQAQYAKHPEAETCVFLPLAHCYGRIHLFLCLEAGMPIAFGSTSSLVDDFKETRPFLIASVPRLYERMYAQIMKKIESDPPARQRVFHAAAQTAREYGRAISNAGKAPFFLGLKHKLFDALVYKKIREATGMTQFVYGTTGAAAIRPDLLYFFQGVGIPILEGYGLTETSAPSNVNPPSKFKPGTVGPPFPGMEMTLADDGEVLMKGPNLFKGYYKLPKETAESFTSDGWFLTGDIGQFDEDGYLKIVDRKKELEVLNTGKKIAPVTVEEKLKLSPFVGEAILTANDRKFAGCIIQPNFDKLVSWADEQGIRYDKAKVIVKPDPTGQMTTYSVGRDLVEDPKVREAYQREVDACNTKCAEYEQIRVWELAEHMFTMDRDELTPTLKKKRRVILKNYAPLVEKMFKSA
ncbi:MAG: long-chain fatty acid--CoA ligase [Candidatus Thermoplasmatota archaeon]